jgi:hypothetical protein
MLLSILNLILNVFLTTDQDFLGSNLFFFSPVKDNNFLCLDLDFEVLNSLFALSLHFGLELFNLYFNYFFFIDEFLILNKQLFNFLLLNHFNLFKSLTISLRNNSN